MPALLVRGREHIEQRDRYPFPKIKALFAPAKCEVLINFMYGHISRFVTSPDAATIASLNPILGGPGWRDRLDKSIPQGAAAEKLFRETLKAEGNFEYVVSTKIDKNTIDRPHFFIAYATKSREGLKAFRQIEYDALKLHAKNRANAKERKREDRTGTIDLFAGVEAEVQEAGIDDIVAQQMALASENFVLLITSSGSIKFEKLIDHLLQTFMLRETNVKDICVQLAISGVIENTWGGGRSKPKDDTQIRLLR